MGPAEQPNSPVRAGDLEGLDTVYSAQGDLITSAGEKILTVSTGWDANVSSPWRRVLPKVIFPGFGGKASSKLFVTTERIVVVREIDTWRELKEELSPLGIPAAAAKEVRLRRAKAAGVRQFCEIRPRHFRVVKMKKLDKRRSWLDMRLVGIDERQYEIILWKTDGLDSKTLSLLQSQFSNLGEASRF